ncbi:MAG: rRNA pseudouridine synthase [Hyphomonadaceae bacterium]|nr:rRNA pseudouridine synthase [Hyphomonadaceae bacterium]
MTERRETGRRTPRPGARRPGKAPRKPTPKLGAEAPGERIAKYLARAGVASRRACETLIEEGKVTIDGRKVKTPAEKVTGREDIRVGGLEIAAPERARIWRYHKPAGLITTNSDPAGRRTVFDELPKSLPRTVTIGRLDLNTEGLLLLTNDGGLARALELPGNDMVRTYRARAFGRVDAGKLAKLASGITVDGERFGKIEAELEQETGANSWLRVSLTEGKKREVRRALEAVGLQVNRLIRISYGPFELGELKPGAVEEVPANLIEDALPGDMLSKARRTSEKPRKSPRGPARSRLGKPRR